MSVSALDAASLRRHYSHFLRPGRVLLTGHSHQAWPDVARAAMLRAFDVAAEHVDDKWGDAFAQAERVRRGIAERLGATPDRIALAPNTHELGARFLSCLDFSRRRHLVTTSGEFHSLDRQLRRLGEAGIALSVVDASPVGSLAERLTAALRPDTAALLASTVLFESAAIVPGLDQAVSAAARVGAEVLLDAYHAYGIVPFTLGDFGASPCFVVGGGYKYAQWGEGVCFLVVPEGCALRPVYTGWFSDFEHLDGARGAGPVTYGSRLADRFAGSTYDPVSHYRAAAVLDFFDEQRLDPSRLRELSQRQTSRLVEGVGGLPLVSPRSADERGGFVALRVPRASQIVAELRRREVYVDSRGDVLRLGPAPYVTDDELDRAVAELRACAGG